MITRERVQGYRYHPQAIPTTLLRPDDHLGHDD